MFQSVTLRNYRSYADASFEFGPSVSIIIGKNASGKTNLLESLYMLCTGSSFRVSDKDIIMTGKEWARLDGVCDAVLRTIKLRRHEPRVTKEFELHGTMHRRLSFEQTLPVVLFEPEDTRLVGGSPKRRRDYLDTVLSSTNPTYKRALASYTKALKQRNNALKKSHTIPNLFAWDVVLAQYGEIIVAERQILIERINQEISAIYSHIADRPSAVVLTYSTTATSSYASRLLHGLERSRERDTRLGFTSLGPHRDDFAMTINGQESHQHASRGEVRTITLGLKVIEMILLEKTRGQKPILLLDDVFSELDGRRRRTLVDYTTQHQTIITTTDADIVDKSFSSNAALITVD
jgi:DNA replication and repair protein RecF